MKVLDLFPNMFIFLRPMPSLLEPPSKFTVTDGFGGIYQVGMFAASLFCMLISKRQKGIDLDLDLD